MADMNHRVRWYGISDGERIPRNRHMNGGDWGWDATCSCGWETRTGGAIEARVREAIAEHRADVRHDETTCGICRADVADYGRCTPADHPKADL